MSMSGKSSDAMVMVQIKSITFNLSIIIIALQYQYCITLCTSILRCRLRALLVLIEKKWKWWCDIAKPKKTNYFVRSKSHIHNMRKREITFWWGETNTEYEVYLSVSMVGPISNATTVPPGNGLKNIIIEIAFRKLLKKRWTVIATTWDIARWTYTLRSNSH